MSDTKTQTKTKQETVNKENSTTNNRPLVEKTYKTSLKLSIRRVNLNAGLPGDDPTNHNPKIGSSLKGRAPLSGLDMEEEKKYLPEIIGVSPKDINWRKEVKDYWSNISEKVPHDEESSTRNLPGRELNFSIIFKNKSDKENFDNAKTFEEKASISKKGEIDPSDVSDYVLFRYCLVYGKVANNFKDRFKSKKIDFYLYSREETTKQKHKDFIKRNNARSLFVNILDEEDKIDAIITLYEQNPDDVFVFNSLEDKHLFLEEKLESKPDIFVNFAKDKNLLIKSMIKQAVDKNIIYRVSNTEKHYFGEDKDVLLGKNLEETVLFLKGNEEKNKRIFETIEAQLKFN